MEVHTGDFSAEIEYDEELQLQDEWLLSPTFTLDNAIVNFWATTSVYWCREMDNCDLELWLVVGEPGDSDDIFIKNLEESIEVSWEWFNFVIILTPDLPAGPFRLGFRYTGSDGAAAYLDDIVLTTSGWHNYLPLISR